MSTSPQIQQTAPSRVAHALGGAGDGHARPAADSAALHLEISSQMGLVPNFFRLAPASPAIAEALWAFAKAAYLHSPLPPAFKERLFIHLSRFCDVRYCLVRHFAFLVGLGKLAGDGNGKPMSAAQAILLLRQSFGPGQKPDEHLDFLLTVDARPDGSIEPESRLETALFAVCTAVYLEPARSALYLRLLRRVLGPEKHEYLLQLIGFIRVAHFWTQVHPELSEEEDVGDLLRQLEEMSWALAWDSREGWSFVINRIEDDLTQLKMVGRRPT